LRIDGTEIKALLIMKYENLQVEPTVKVSIVEILTSEDLRS